MDVGEYDGGDVDLKLVVQCRDQWRVVVDMKMNLLVLNELCFWTLFIVWCLKNKQN
jgi:hypothetical protein